MATAFPSTVDTFTDPLSSDTLNSVTVPHHLQHTNANDAITAIQTAILGLRLDLAASVLVPGATTFSIRNNANSQDNFLVSNGGNATLRGALTLGTTTSTIIPGTTSLSLRNNANTADNLLLTDTSIVADDTTTLRQLYTARSVTSAGSASPGGSTNAYFGFQSNPTLSGANGLGSFYALHGVSNNSSSGGTQVQIGTTGRAYWSGSGTVAELIGMYATVNTTGGTGTIASASGLEIHALNEAQGTTAITEFRGLNIPVISVGGAGTTVGAMRGIYLGMPNGATTQNIGMLIGQIPVSAKTSMLYVAETFTDPTAAFDAVFVNPSVTLTGNNAFAMTAVNATMNAPATSAANFTSQVAGGVFTGKHTGTGTITTLVGVQGLATINTNGGGVDGNVTNAYGVSAGVLSFGSGATPGVITSGRTFFAASPAFGSTGTITNQYGMYIANQGNAKVTSTSWGLLVAAQSGSVANSHAAEFQGGAVRMTTSMTKVRASNSIWNGLSVLASTYTSTTHGAITTATGLNLVNIAIPAIVTDAAGAITSSATLAILGQPTISGGGSITLALALDVQGGNVRIGTNVANGSVATAMSSVGPVGSNTTIQEWFVIYNAAGVARYIPAF